jgi:hypothetical protein
LKIQNNWLYLKIFIFINQAKTRILDRLFCSLMGELRVKAKKSGAIITGTVQSIKNGHFVLKCNLGSIAIFFNSIEDINYVTE